MPDLASLDDVTARVTRALTGAETSRATVLITDASNWVKRYTRQDFTEATTTQTLRALGATIILPQTPVIAVTAVSLRDYLGNLFAVPAFGFDGIDRIDLTPYRTVLNLPETLSFSLTWAGTVDVTYTHGYGTVPPEIVGVVAQAVADVFNAPAATPGLQSQSMGPFNATYEKGSVAGRPVFGDDARLILNQYRRGGVAAVEMR